MISPDYIDREGNAHWEDNSIPEMASGDKVMQYINVNDSEGINMYIGDYVEIEIDAQSQHYLGGNTRTYTALCVVIFTGCSFKLKRVSANSSKKSRNWQHISPLDMRVIHMKVVGNIFESKKITQLI